MSKIIYMPKNVSSIDEPLQHEKLIPFNLKVNIYANKIILIFRLFNFFIIIFIFFVINKDVGFIWTVFEQS